MGDFMGKNEIEDIIFNVSSRKNILSKNINIDILLYLAKYNPKVTVNTIIGVFGEKTLSNLRELESINMIKREEDNISLSNEGIFQLDNMIKEI